jgi:hypothetical protein
MLIRPRITDYYGISSAQSELDFAIPFLDEDLPLYVDPFLLWKSPSLQDQALHTGITNCFNNLGRLLSLDRKEEAISQLIVASECAEVGLGMSRKRVGTRISSAKAEEILSLFDVIPFYRQNGFTHFEEIQLYVKDISKDRVSDICCSFIKSFLIDYTMQECADLGIPVQETVLDSLYDYPTNSFRSNVAVKLPVNPDSGSAILFVPKRWLRFSPWISLEDYFKDYCPKDKVFEPDEAQEAVKLLRFNRDNYGMVRDYVAYKERTQADCFNDPLFRQIPIVSARRKLNAILKLATGKAENADRKYEDYVAQLLCSLLYPHVDFAAEQSRTISGTQIRDLIFYNNAKIDFLREVREDYGSRQLVFELKNVQSIERDHINQLNRYLDSGLGKFGVLMTRNQLPRAMYRNLIDLWAGQRRCIVSLTDDDLRLMVNVFESKQREPIEVLKKKYLEFRRDCPA